MHMQLQRDLFLHRVELHLLLLVLNLLAPS